MDDLLKVPEIVTNIASYLSTVDYLSFQQVNKRVYAIINGKNDSKYWSLKLTRMGLQQVHSNEEEEITLLDEMIIKIPFASSKYTNLSLLKILKKSL